MNTFNFGFIRFLFAVSALLLWVNPGYAQNEPGHLLTIEGEVTTPLKLSMEDLRKFPQTTLEVTGMNGDVHKYGGVNLSEILAAAGVALGEELRGENLVKYLLFHASDGYEVIFSLPEIDPGFTGNRVLLAVQMDGKPLPPGIGPFRIIAPSDKKPARWIRELASIQVMSSK